MVRSPSMDGTKLYGDILSYLLKHYGDLEVAVANHTDVDFLGNQNFSCGKPARDALSNIGILRSSLKQLILTLSFPLYPL